MPYIYPEADGLENTSKVGSKQCVALLQHYTNIPNTAFWHEGKSVFEDENKIIHKGTAIATFSNGVYSNHSTGNHAAFFLSKDANGIWIMDQWKDDKRKPFVSKRYIRRKGKNSKGGYNDPSNNADAYSIIE
ncbi:BPSL0067 family protein [Pseudomonas mangiferae]|uniref:BPSL0067 family protein n=1 Tax=Pseudomonas mangiferae TaxID=2593654 RepID=A0A553H0A9_9PSED|nr:BPSL0067 family protein [Pseudomonas mangiferae]TRX75143.1 BPSL0067 family protein [Pseudomonas mangiferae]